MTKRILTTVLLVAIVISSVSCKKAPVKGSTSKTDSSITSSTSVATSSKTSLSPSTSKVSSSNVSSSSKASSKVSSSKASSIVPEKTAFQYFDEADKKMDTLKSFRYTEDFTYNMAIGEITFNTKVLNIVTADTLNNQKRFYVFQTKTTGGQSTMSSACYNGKYYVSQTEDNYLVKSFEEYLEEYPDVWGQDQSEDMPDILATDIVSSTKGAYSGGTTVNLVVKGSKFNEYLSKSIADEGTTVSSVNLEDVTIDAKINNNGYYVELNAHIKGQIALTIEGVSSTMSIDFTTKQTITNPGTAVTVTIPYKIPQ